MEVTAMPYWLALLFSSSKGAFSPLGCVLYYFFSSHPDVLSGHILALLKILYSLPISVGNIQIPPRADRAPYDLALAYLSFHTGLSVLQRVKIFPISVPGADFLFLATPNYLLHDFLTSLHSSLCSNVIG